MDSTTHDLLVIGSGPAGSSAAMAAARFGKRVAVIEREPVVGGAGINTGTIPSKALRESALLLSGWRSRRLLGVDVSVRRQATIAELSYHSVHVRQDMRVVTGERLGGCHVEIVTGEASFVDPHELRVQAIGGSSFALRGDRILIAVGSSPVRPPQFPFDHPRIHDSDQILDISTMPRCLAVVGAGVIGAEYACTFAALGVEVHLIDGRRSLLPFLDSEISRAITAGMERAGVHFRWGQRVAGCTIDPDENISLALSSGETLRCTDVLVAAGRSRNTGTLDMAAAGVVTGKRGLIPVNQNYQTSMPHIYAAGDVIGAPALAATGMEQGRAAVRHAFGMAIKNRTDLLPTGIYTIPEASMCGTTEDQVRRSGLAYVVGRARYRENPRGNLIGDRDGLLKLIFRREDMRLLGVHIVGEQATEVVHVGMMAMLAEADAGIFDRACFNYPTLGGLYKQAAYDALAQKMGPGGTPA